MVNSRPEVECIICKNRAFRYFTAKNNLSLVKCKSCGLVFRHPLPDSAELAGFYPDDYYDNWGFDRDPEAVRNLKYQNSQKYLNMINEFVPAGRILDVGCAMGYFMDVARKGGWEPHGVEICRYSAGLAKQKHGEAVFMGTLEERKFASGYFQVITLFDLFEHLDNPSLFLGECHRLLSDGGMLVIVIPNTRSISALLMSGNWFHFLPEHIYYFSPLNIGWLLKKAGFGVIKLTPAPKVLDFNYIANQLKGHPVPVVTRLVRLAEKILPRWLKELPLSFGVGEMLVLAQKVRGVNHD